MSLEHELDFYFGFKSFRPGQTDVINHLLQTKDDAICTFPCAFGKSIIYCIPALFSREAVLVISPLCSLIQDQVQKLNLVTKTAFNLSASCDSELSDETVVFSEEFMIKSGPVFLFCTPEKVASSYFLQKLKRFHDKRPFQYFVLDEAHLLSEQGFSFRPDFLKLGVLRDEFPNVRFFCFSATCNAFSQEILRSVLKLKNTEVFSVSDDRKNMNINIHYCSKTSKRCTCGSQTCTWRHSPSKIHPSFISKISTYSAGEVLILTNSRKDVEKIQQEVQSALPQKFVEAYHGNMEDEERSRIQSRFLCKHTDIIVATIASFGVGVDMPLLRHICLFGIPLNIYSFIQTIGRGGRNGQEYVCDVFVKESDILKQNAVLKSEISTISSSKRKYIEFLRSSHDMMVSVIKGPISKKICISNYIKAILTASRQVLNVEFKHLERFKKINNRLCSSDKARWSSVDRIWYLPPLAYHKSLEAYGAQSPVQVGRCEKCSVCIQTCAGGK